MTTSQRTQLLTLSGGGFRGLYSASVLAELEVATKRPIARSFELIAGTSIGGIVALAACFEIPMTRVVETFKEHGATIFPNSRRQHPFRRIRDYLFETYDQDHLRFVIEKVIDKDACLGDSLHPVVIPAVNVSQGRPQVFKTRHHHDFDRDWRIKAVDVALATSAAPLFFRPAVIDNNLCVDGGLFANSPTLLAIHEATHFLQQPVSCLWMLSVGTTTSQYSIVDDGQHSWGMKFWLGDAERRLPQVLLAAQQQYVDQICAHMLGKRLLQLDSNPSYEQASHLGLDKVTQESTTILEALGRKVGSDARGNAYIRAVLAHDAANWLLTT